MGHTSQANGKLKTMVPEPEVQPKTNRRRFSAAYKLKIVQEADACEERGAIGSLLRREGLYSSQLATWRQQRDAGLLSDKQRGRKANPEAKAMAQLQRENDRLQQELRKAQLIIEAQKKLAEILGLMLSPVDETSE